MRLPLRILYLHKTCAPIFFFCSAVAAAVLAYIVFHIPHTNYVDCKTSTLLRPQTTLTHAHTIARTPSRIRIHHGKKKNCLFFPLNISSSLFSTDLQSKRFFLNVRLILLPCYSSGAAFFASCRSHAVP